MTADEFIPSPPEPGPTPLRPPDRNNRDEVQGDIAKADKIVRSGSSREKVRDAPPAGAWNDTSSD
jgi:hypothetical protein